MNLKKFIKDILHLSKGEHSLKGVLALAGIKPVLHIDTQPRTLKEFQEDHVYGEVLEDRLLELERERTVGKGGVCVNDFDYDEHKPEEQGSELTDFIK